MTASTKKIKVLLGISDFRIGGAQKLSVDLVNRFDPNIFELYLVTLFQSGNEETFYNQLKENVVLKKLNFKSFYDWASWLSLYKTLKEINPDVVCSNLFFSNTAFRALKVFFSYQVIVVEHNMYIRKTHSQKLVDLVLSFVTFKIVTVSKQVSDFIKSTELISHSKFVVIQNGVDVQQIQNRASVVDVPAFKKSVGLNPEDKIILSIGQLIRQKNHALLVDAFALFTKRHSEYVLVILGGGSLKGELEEKISSYGLSQKINLLGISKDLPSFYASSDFFVLPSIFEGFALVCIEAMSAGLPVVATKVAGPNEYVKQGRNGLFSDFDPDDLCEKMSCLASSVQAHREEMSLNAKQTAALYDITECAAKYQALFLQAVKIND